MLTLSAPLGPRVGELAPNAPPWGPLRCLRLAHCPAGSCSPTAWLDSGILCARWRSRMRLWSVEDLPNYRAVTSCTRPSVKRLQTVACTMVLGGKGRQGVFRVCWSVWCSVGDGDRGFSIAGVRS